MRRYLWLIPPYLLASCLPLLSRSGQNLEYEYATLVGVLGLVFIPLSALLIPSSLIPRNASGYSPYKKFEAIWIALAAPVFMILPGSIAFLTGQCPCSQNGYWTWMLIQAFPSWLLGSAAYQVILFFRCRQVSRVRLSAAFFLAVTLLLAHVGSGIWFNPQVRLTHLFSGFLHGPIYDTWIPLDNGVVLARVSHAIIAILTLMIVFWQRRPFYLLCLASVVSCWIAAGFGSMRFPSQGYGIDSLTSVLPNKLEHQDFTLHYLADSVKSQQKALDIYKEAIFHTEEIKTYFDGNIPKRTHIFVYPDRNKKKLWFGGGSTDVADVWTPSIHITMSRSPHPTLRHELVHALASKGAFHGLGFHPNMAFTEGLAVALAPEQRKLSLHQSAAALAKSDRLPALRNLFSPLFWLESGSRAYAAAGSIILYVQEKYGDEAVRSLYSGSSWESATKKSKRTVLTEWRDYVLSSFANDNVKLYADAIFRNPGALHDLCPHSKADLRQSRQSDLYARLRQPLGWDPSLDYWNWRVQLDLEDRRARTILWRKEIQRITNNRTIAKGRLLTWLETINRSINWPPESLEDAELSLMESDIRRVMDEPEASLEILNKLRSQNDITSFGNSITRQIGARLAIESSLEGETAKIWRRYLAGWKVTLPSLSEKEPWILTYLRLRRADKDLLRSTNFERLVDTPLPAELPATFAEEWYRILGVNYVRLNQFELAQRSFAKASISTDSSQRYFEQLQRWARRLEELTPIETGT